MACIALSIPIFPGKTEEFKRLANEMTGPKLANLRASQQRHGITKEQWFVQHTPQGDMIIIYLEANDIAAIFQTFAASKDPFDLWMKQSFKALHGVDFNQPMAGPPPEQILQFP